MNNNLLQYEVFLSQCKTKHEINNFHLPVYCVFLMVALGSYFHGFYVQIVMERHTLKVDLKRDTCVDVAKFPKKCLHQCLR